MALLHSTAVLHFICSTRLLAETTPSVGFQNTIFVWREAQKTLVLLKKERLCNDPHLSNLGYYEVSELVSRIEKYVSTKSGDSINLPVAEAMVTYKEKTYDDGESSQVFVPFVRYDHSNTSNFDFVRMK